MYLKYYDKDNDISNKPVKKRHRRGSITGNYEQLKRTWHAECSQSYIRLIISQEKTQTHMFARRGRGSSMSSTSSFFKTNQLRLGIGSLFVIHAKYA